MHIEWRVIMWVIIHKDHTDMWSSSRECSAGIADAVSCSSQIHHVCEQEQSCLKEDFKIVTAL